MHTSFFPCPQHAVHAMHAKHAKNYLKWRKYLLFHHLTLFGHFKGPTTWIIMYDSPPCTMGRLVQYHTHLAPSIKLCKITQYMWKLLKNYVNPYYLIVSTFLVTLKVRLLELLYMAALLVPWECLYSTIDTFPSQ